MSTFDGSAGGDMGNKVMVEHEDGTIAVYAHVRTGTVAVTKGQKVELGDKLAESSNISGHLHMAVWNGVKGAKTIPFAFYDVEGGYADGSAQNPIEYTSGNPGRNGVPVIKYNPAGDKVGNGGGGSARKPKGDGDPVKAQKMYEKGLKEEEKGKIGSAVKNYEKALDEGLKGDAVMDAQKRVDSLTADAVKSVEEAKGLIAKSEFDPAFEILRKVKRDFNGASVAKDANDLMVEAKASDAYAEAESSGEAKEIWDEAKKAEEAGLTVKAQGLYQKLIFEFGETSYGKKAYEAIQNLGGD
jgi:hypothetical protein